MAMTGGTTYLVKSEKTNYGSNSWTTDLYIYVKVISQNVIANCSTIALGMPEFPAARTPCCIPWRRRSIITVTTL